MDICAICETYHCFSRPTPFDCTEVLVGLKQLKFFYFVLLCLYMMPLHRQATCLYGGTCMKNILKFSFCFGNIILLRCKVYEPSLARTKISHCWVADSMLVNYWIYVPFFRCLINWMSFISFIYHFIYH